MLFLSWIVLLFFSHVKSSCSLSSDTSGLIIGARFSNETNDNAAVIKKEFNEALAEQSALVQAQALLISQLQERTRDLELSTGRIIVTVERKAVSGSSYDWVFPKVDPKFVTTRHASSQSSSVFEVQSCSFSDRTDTSLNIRFVEVNYVEKPVDFVSLFTFSRDPSFASAVFFSSNTFPTDHITPVTYSLDEIPVVFGAPEREFSSDTTIDVMWIPIVPTTTSTELRAYQALTTTTAYRFGFTALSPSLVVPSGFQFGVFLTGATSANEVVFPTAFSSIPAIVLQVVDNDSNSLTVCNVNTASASSFTFSCRYQLTAEEGCSICYSIHWMAAEEGTYTI